MCRGTRVPTHPPPTLPLAAVTAPKVANVAVTSDKGLCGGLNTNIAKYTRMLIKLNEPTGKEGKPSMCCTPAIPRTMPIGNPPFFLPTQVTLYLSKPLLPSETRAAHSSHGHTASSTPSRCRTHTSPSPLHRHVAVAAEGGQGVANAGLHMMHLGTA